MAQLFQPTNITPDTRGAFGNGIVFRRTGVTSLTVSWQINGNTPMTAYKIDFTSISGSSLYSTGKVTLGTPAYGTSANGEPVLFSCEIDSLPSSVTSISEGLMRITQWWGNGTNDYIVQQSPSHYIVRDKLSASISPTGPSNPLTGRNGTFTGTIYGASEDGIMWIRWALRNGDTGELLKDTGKLYGSVDPTFTYDAFLPGMYTITLYAETSTGVTMENTSFIYVSYDASEVGLPITASRDCNGESAVSIRWPRLQSIPLSATDGSVTDNGRVINLATDNTYLEWDAVNGNPMRLNAPWSAIWSGSVTALGDNIFEIQTQNARYSAYVTSIDGSGALIMLIDIRTESGPPVPPKILTLDAEWNEGQVMCILTPTAVYWKFISNNGALLYPQEYLYPSETLYPGRLEETTTMILRHDIPSDVTQTSITSVSLYGRSSVEYFQILDHAMQEAEINCYLAGNATANYGIDSLFYIGPRGREQDYNAGNYPESLQNGTTIQIYRESGNSSALEYAGKTVAGGGNQILDYAARSQQGPYKYYMYVLSSEKYINVPSISNEVNPCFWDWVVLSCTEKSDGSFAVQSSYRFGNNLTSGSITNNNQPGVFKNFTPYPTVMIAPQNYQSGTLQSLIGVINNGEYSDTINLRDAIYELSTTKNTLFLKNRKGDLLKIRPTDSITMETMDNTRAQAQTVSFPWAEVGDASDAVIYSAGDST